MLCVERFGGCEVIRNGGCRFAKHIRHYRVKHDIVNGKGVLKTVFLTASHRDEFATVSRELSQDANVLAVDKTASFGILGIVLVSLYSLHLFGVSHDDPDTTPFKDIENGHPVFACELHVDIEAAVFMEPVGEAVEAGIERGKTLFLIARL